MASRNRGLAALTLIVAVFLAPTRLPAAPRKAAHARPLKFSCQLIRDSGRNAFGILPGDWNGDGRIDLAVSYTGSGTLTSFLNRGRRRFEAQPEVAIGEIARGIAAADLNGDHHPDLAVAIGMSIRVAMLRGSASGTFAAEKPLTAGFAPFQTAFADLDGDHAPDLVVVNESNMGADGPPGIVSVVFAPRLGEAAKPLSLTAGAHPADVAIGDFDGRNGPDLAVANWLSGTVSIFLNQGDRSFAPAREIDYGGQNPFGIYAADLSRNGTLDLALSDLGNEGVWVLEGDGTGSFDRSGFFKTAAGTRSVSGGDLNRDGIIDLVTADTAAGTVSILIGLGQGKFAPATSIAVGPQPRQARISDLDGDGLPDIVASLLGANDAALLFQTKGRASACVAKQPHAKGRGK